MKADVLVFNWVFAMSWLLLADSAVAQVFDERFDDWPIDLKIKGTVVISDAESVSQDHLKRCFAKAEDKTIAVIFDDALPADLWKSLEQTFKQTFRVSIDDANDLPDANIIAFYSKHGEAGTTSKWSLPVEQSMQRMFSEGKTLLLVGSGHDRLGARYFTGEAASPAKTVSGLSFLPDCLLKLNIDSWDAVQERFQGALASLPRHIGIGLERNTTLILEGRRFRVVGEGSAHFYIATCDHRPSRMFKLSERKSRSQSPSEWQVDLTEWRRDSMDRTLPAFPPPEVRLPRVENGTLVIVGGGGLPDGLMTQFVEYAGGTEKAKLVYIPCLEEEVYSAKKDIIQTWQSMGVRHTARLHTKDRRIANSDEPFLSPLRDATGIWFGGGRQWNLSDSYYGTTAHRLMKDVLRRGGVIGGSSAGASIQGRYLARATPIENFRIMAPGYERGGLGFLDGVAIDQHFSQRKRQSDMEELVKRYPQLLGIGIDEGTGLVVQESIAQVIGRGQAFFYDWQEPNSNAAPDIVPLSDGQSYDMEKRSPLMED
jgi:cyanophycinase